MNIAFIIDPIMGLDPTHDSSVAMMEAASELGHTVWITQQSQLSVKADQAWATLQQVNIHPVKLVDGNWVAPQPWFTLGSIVHQPLETMQAVFMRADPPVDTAYLYTTYILDYVDPRRTLVMNRPAGLRAANEKMYALQFQDAIPKTVVTQDKQVIREFLEAEGAAVIKPLGGKAGEGILFLEAGDRNFNSLVEISTQQGQLPIMVQAYLPDAKLGDKRIIVLDGAPIGTVNRVPTGEDFRGNMAVGGRAEASPLTDRERAICRQLAPKLRQDGLIFVGVDVIGGYLTEVNVTSPTGIREADRLGLNPGESPRQIGHQVIRWVEQQITP
ncbi:glutathione synthase [filamentous cyanobacterium LEGE 11480]|uniref:Glutathione synthetase n=1 Tax=Romeriopsis navalis LEGE 11480 TaxID=2777977 RepID=A0A928VQY1_9CYAN|nr:glutathione synthase [Romeriopsis navalis]MBE9030907.1 glutathione synthase [Romeriopsis navalis LEGE 11480]